MFHGRYMQGNAAADDDLLAVSEPARVSEDDRTARIFARIYTTSTAVCKHLYISTCRSKLQSKRLAHINLM